MTGVPGLGRGRCYWPWRDLFYHQGFYQDYPDRFEYFYYSPVTRLDNETEISLLEDRERWLRENLEEISVRIAELKKGTKKKSVKGGD